LLRGEWLIGLSASGRALDFAPSDAVLQLSGGGSFERLAPSSVGLVKTTGAYSVEAGAAGKRELALRLDVESASLGPLPLPLLSRSNAERVVLLDALMCVTAPAAGPAGDYTVYVRPSMRRPTEDEEA